MKWVTGLRSGVLYTIEKRPLDPRFSENDLQVLLGYCANAQAFGWSDDRAFNAAEAIIMRSKNHGITWSNSEFMLDVNYLSEITLNQEEQRRK